MGHTFNPGAYKSLKFNHTVRAEVYSTNYMDYFLSIFSIYVLASIVLLVISFYISLL